MFFLIPGTFSITVYFLIAVVPAILLLIYVYRQDSIEKEPLGLLLSLLFLGCVAAGISMVLEMIGDAVLGVLIPDNTSNFYTILSAFLVIAVVEEGSKYFLMSLRTWNHPAFNFRFDGIVYSVFVSLGFAALENILYVFGYGIGVGFSRAFLSIPGHMGFAVLNGIFYGRARMYENRGQNGLCILNLLVGYTLAVLLHGFYDATAMTGTPLAILLFVLAVVIIYLTIFLIVRHEAKTDRPI